MTVEFGTDGVRGRAGTELSAEIALAIGRAAVRVLGREAPFAVARDTRRSGPMLEAALVAGLCSQGADVRLLGVLPTPGLALACRDGDRPGAMISASHNPYPDNGIKLFERGGRKLRDATEARIEAEVRSIVARGGEPREGAEIGAVEVEPDAVDAYVRRVVDAVRSEREAGAEAGSDAAPLAGLRVIVDCGHGAASEAGPRIVEALGARVDAIGASPTGTNINDGVGSTHLEALQAAVRDEGADAGLAFDGDADRMVAVDENGAVVDGDHVLAIMARDLRARGRLAGEAIATTVMANLGLRRALEPEGIRVIETAVGDRHVLAAMEEHGLILGGEQSGHLIFLDHQVTGDGPLAGALLLDVLARAGVPLSRLAAAVVKYPQVLLNVPLADGVSPSDAGFRAELQAVERELAGAGRVVVRPSGTEPVVRVMVEAESAEQAEALARRLAAALTP